MRKAPARETDAPERNLPIVEKCAEESEAFEGKPRAERSARRGRKAPRAGARRGALFARKYRWAVLRHTLTGTPHTAPHAPHTVPHAPHTTSVRCGAGLVEPRPRFAERVGDLLRAKRARQVVADVQENVPDQGIRMGERVCRLPDGTGCRP